MKNKKIFFLAFISFLIVGCNSIGGVNLTDTRGNKYKFKNESVTCEENSRGSIYCEGSAIKTDIAGKRDVVDFVRTFCQNPSKTYMPNYFICSAAKELGKL